MKLLDSIATEAASIVASALINIAQTYTGEEGQRRLREQHYDEDVIKSTQGVGTQVLKFRGGMPLLGMTREKLGEVPKGARLLIDISKVDTLQAAAEAAERSRRAEPAPTAARTAPPPQMARASASAASSGCATSRAPCPRPTTVPPSSRASSWTSARSARRGYEWSG